MREKIVSRPGHPDAASTTPVRDRPPSPIYLPRIKYGITWLLSARDGTVGAPRRHVDRLICFSFYYRGHRTKINAKDLIHLLVEMGRRGGGKNSIKKQFRLGSIDIIGVQTRKERDDDWQDGEGAIFRMVHSSKLHYDLVPYK
ncbi:hypothetical protein MTP99_006073 [Tenebrio molitor]|nr:hypothetical protein MTP99_006073 [Tenebrio molitor]